MYPVGLGYILYDLLDLVRTYSQPGRSSPPIWVPLGLGRIVTLYCRPSTLYQIH
jgi:hypothetical protein